MKHLLSVLACCAAALSALHGQGTFPPATGPLVPTMKSLEQVEPRKPLPASATALPPYNINEPGSYYLTKNIAVTTGNAINIQISNVTLDLNGFTVSSTQTGTETSTAIMVADSSNVVIHNGIIRGTSTYNPNNSTFSSTGGFRQGIYANGSGKNVVIRDITMQGIAGVAISLSGTGTISDCTITECDGITGISAHTVSDCTMSDCAGYGITAKNVTRCMVLARNTGASGVVAALEADSVVTDCYAINRGGGGIRGRTVNNCIGNGATGINGAAVSNSLGLTNQFSGFVATAGISSIGTVSFSRGELSGGSPLQTVIALGCTVPPDHSVSGSSVKQYCYPP